MQTRRSRYLRHRFPPEIISHAVWLYHRFSMSFRDVEDLLAERGIVVSYETVRRWCQKFGRDYVRRLKRRQGRLGDTWFVDEVFVTINGQRQYLWRAVDQDGDVIDILVQPGSPVIRPTLLRRFLDGTRRASPVARRVLVTVLSLLTPPEWYIASTSLRCTMRPSSSDRELGLRGLRIFGATSAFTCVTAR